MKTAASILLCVLCTVSLAGEEGGWIYRQYDSSEQSIARYQSGELTVETFPTETVRIGGGAMPVLARHAGTGALYCYVMNGPLHRSADEGRTWQQVATPPSSLNPAFGVLNSGTMLLGGSWPHGGADRMTAFRIFRSTDSGTNWDGGRNVSLSGLVLPNGQRPEGDFFQPHIGFHGGPANLLGAYGRIIELSDGTAVLPFYIEGNSLMGKSSVGLPGQVGKWYRIVVKADLDQGTVSATATPPAADAQTPPADSYAFRPAVDPDRPRAPCTRIRFQIFPAGTLIDNVRLATTPPADGIGPEAGVLFADTFEPHEAGADLQDVGAGYSGDRGYTVTDGGARGSDRAVTANGGDVLLYHGFEARTTGTLYFSADVKVGPGRIFNMHIDNGAIEGRLGFMWDTNTGPKLGGVYCGAETTVEATLPAAPTAPTYALLARSLDDGQTWSDVSLVSVDFNEWGLLETPDGELLAAMRGQTIHQEWGDRWKHLNLHALTGFIRSLDKGRTWSRYEIIAGAWTRSEHASDILRLSDGTLVVPTIRRGFIDRFTYRYRSIGNIRGVPVTVSLDNGVTWSRDHRIAIRTDVGNAGMFPTSIVLEDDTIVTVDGHPHAGGVWSTRWRLPPAMRRIVENDGAP